MYTGIPVRPPFVNYSSILLTEHDVTTSASWESEVVVINMGTMICLLVLPHYLMAESGFC